MLMELGAPDRPSSPCSSSSFDSCSDILSFLNNSSHQFISENSTEYLAFAREGNHELLIDTLLGSACIMMDGKLQVHTGGLVSSLDAKLIEGKDPGDNSVHTNHCEDEGATMVVEAHYSESHAEEFGSMKHETKEKHAKTTSTITEVNEDCMSNVRGRVSSGDMDIQQLENSIKFFDLYHKNTSVPHPLRCMRSRFRSPDGNLFEDDDAAEIVSSERRRRRSFSFGTMKQGMMLANAPRDKLESASLLPWLNYEETRKKNLTGIVEKVDFQFAANKDRMLAMHFDNLSKTTGSKSSLDGRTASLAQVFIDKEESGHYAELPGQTHARKLSSNSQVEKRTGESISPINDDLGPDEISRYLESLHIPENYLDAIDNKHTILDEDNLHAGSVLNTDAGQRSSISGSLLLHPHCVLSANEVPFAVNSVQVVGARQRRGGSSMWQRMVGVKDHTVYCIKVVSGKHEWEVQRRYRDFMNFYWQLKRIFNSGSGTSLPSFSQEVENDSRRVLGNTSPTVVEARVVCIEKFLQSLLQVGPPYSTATPLFWFLRPPQGAFEKTGFEEHLMVQDPTLQKSIDVQLGTLNTSPLQLSPSILENSRKEQTENGVPFTVGKTIKLVLTIHQHDSLWQVLRAQHHSCAGCYRHLDYEKGLIHGFVQAFGRGKPRFCEYTGQLFCSSCHSNELAVVPAYVLWHWDFSQKRVCQFAKAYLDSIYDQPLLCLSTANPYLYQRVPCLSNLQETRTKLSRVLSCMRCPLHSRILNIMGSRRYLLESNDFFALRDLVDLSKGAFAVLPGLLTSVLKTLMLHVTKQCSICQDSGEWCGAGILCDDPFQPIFPFNEEVNVVNCKVCNAPFHQNCFTKCPSCPACPKNWVGMNPLKTSIKT